MPVYTPPALNAVDFELSVQPSHSVSPYVMTLTSYTVPALNAINFSLTTYTQPVYNTIDFEMLSPPSSPVEVFPGVGVLTMTGFAPTVTVSSPQVVYPGVGVLVMTGYAPTVSIATAISQGEIRWASGLRKPKVTNTASKKPPKKYQPKWFGSKRI